MSASTPRAHRDRTVIEDKRSRLDEPHIAPLSELVREIGRATGRTAPWFDPDSGGIHAKVLFLLENPGPRASAERGSGFISVDNDDGSAENFFTLHREAELPRDQFISWNIVPWYQPASETRTANATRADVDEARPWLETLIRDKLTELRLVVTMGAQARDGWMRLLATDPSIPLLPTIAVPHCSPRNLNGRPHDRHVILGGMRRAAKLTRCDPTLLDVTRR